MELPVDTTAGKLEITVGKDVPQGELVNVLVEAINTDLKDRATVPLAAFVRGAPGEIDTSYGEQGVVSFAAARRAFASPATGELYLVDGPLGRYRADGKLDTFTGASASSGGAALAGDFIYQCHAAETGGEFESIVQARRLSLVTGQWDDTYKPTSPVRSGVVSMRACLVSPAGQVALTGASYGQVYPPTYGHVSWFTAAGGYAGDLFIGNPDELGGGVYVADGVVLTTKTGIAKVKTGSTGALDASFGTQGRVEFPGAGPIASIIESSDKKLLVANATYTARLSASGALDASFVAAATGLSPTGTFARLAQQSDGKILKAIQLGSGPGRTCAVSRYLPTGALDSSFGNQGTATYPVSPCSPDILSVLPDQKILVGSPNVLRIWD
jgi:hypothetical protein